MIQCAYRVGALFMSSSLPLSAHEWDRASAGHGIFYISSTASSNASRSFASLLRHVACIPPNIDSQCILFLRAHTAHKRLRSLLRYHHLLPFPFFLAVLLP